MNAREALEILNSAAGDGGMRDPLYDKAYDVLRRYIAQRRLLIERRSTRDDRTSREGR